MSGVERGAIYLGTNGEMRRISENDSLLEDEVGVGDDNVEGKADEEESDDTGSDVDANDDESTATESEGEETESSDTEDENGQDEKKVAVMKAHETSEQKAETNLKAAIKFAVETEEGKIQLRKQFKTSTALMKYVANPFQCQHPTNRLSIWRNIEKMMESRGYHWIRDGSDPTPDKFLLPQNNKMILYRYHKHAEKAGAEPVYVIFCLQTGDPTLKTVPYPSRHILIVSDKITPKARKKINEQSAQLRKRLGVCSGDITFPPVEGVIEQQKEAKQSTAPLIPAASRKVAPQSKRKKKVQVSPIAFGDLRVPPTVYKFEDVLIEGFLSSSLRFSLLEHRYNCTTTFRRATKHDLAEASQVFGADPKRFPSFLANDPVVRHFGLYDGAVMREETCSSTAGFAHSFRTVVSKKEK